MIYISANILKGKLFLVFEFHCTESDRLRFKLGGIFAADHNFDEVKNWLVGYVDSITY